MKQYIHATTFLISLAFGISQTNPKTHMHFLYIFSVLLTVLAKFNQMLFALYQEAFECVTSALQFPTVHNLSQKTSQSTQLRTYSQVLVS